MAKYNKSVVLKICELVKTDSYTIREICDKVNINIDTYYDWKNNKPEFSEALQKAEQEFTDKILIIAKKSLYKLVEGYSYDEKKTITVNDGNGQPKIKEQTIIKKTVSPNLGAIIHLQTNRDSANWKNRQNTEVTGKDGKDLIPARVLTKKEAQEFLSDLENEC